MKCSGIDPICHFTGKMDDNDCLMLQNIVCAWVRLPHAALLYMNDDWIVLYTCNIEPMYLTYHVVNKIILLLLCHHLYISIIICWNKWDHIEHIDDIWFSRSVNSNEYIHLLWIQTSDALWSWWQDFIVTR